MPFGLPGWVYRPGCGSTPDRAPLEAAKATVPLLYRGVVPADDPAVRYGAALYEAGFFWEAHEVWEAVWKAAPQNGRDRIALRAVIQLANAGLKLRMERPKATLRLLGEVASGLSDLAASPSLHQPTSVADRLPHAEIAAAVASLGERIAAGDDPTGLPMPVIGKLMQEMQVHPRQAPRTCIIVQETGGRDGR